MYPYVVSMLLVGVRMYPYVTRMYPYVSICYSYVTRMYPCGVLVKIVRGYFRILGDGNMFSWPLPLWGIVGRFKWESMFGLSARTKWSGRCREPVVVSGGSTVPSSCTVFKNWRRSPSVYVFCPSAAQGVTQQAYIRGGSGPRSNPLPFRIPFFTKKVPPLVYLPLINGTLHIPCLELCISFNCCKCNVI